MRPQRILLGMSLLLAWPAAAPAMVSETSAELRQYVRARLHFSDLVGPDTW